MRPVLEAWVRIIAAARAAGVPIIYTTPVSRADGADVVMLIGARLNWLLSHGKGKTWGGKSQKDWGGQKFVQIDISPQEADSNVRIDAPLVGDIGSCVSALLAGMGSNGAKPPADWLNAIAEQRAKERAAAGFQAAPGASTDATHFNHAATRTMAALDYAFKMNPDAICLVSDGIPTDGGFGGTDILTKLKSMQAAIPCPAVINVVAYLADGGQKFMADLAAQNQGSFKEIKPGMSSFGF